MLNLVLDKCSGICYTMRMIKIYDNFMTQDELSTLYSLAVTGNYSIGWDDTSTIENRQYPCLYMEFPKIEWAELQQYFDNCPELAGLEVQKGVVNLTTPSSINFRHTHGKDSRVFLYYLNPEWREEWYGETIFYGDKGEDNRVISYEPNRAVIFDGHHPHSIRPASHIAPSYRFTLSIFFELQDKNSS